MGQAGMARAFGAGRSQAEKQIHRRGDRQKSNGKNVDGLCGLPPLPQERRQG